LTGLTGEDQGGRRSLADATGHVPLELRLAVTGHCALADARALGQAIGGVLDLIVETLPTTIRSECRLVAVSALADEADRLVAQSVLARPGGRLEVILPMPAADDVAHFDPVSSLPQCERLLREASRVSVAPPSPMRDDAYLAAGKAIADRADITIAIWDGRRVAGQGGGTGEIVSYVRHQRRPLIWLPPDGGEPVCENLQSLAETGWFARMTTEDLSRLHEFNAARVRAGQSSALLGDFALPAGDGDTALAGRLKDLTGWVGPPFRRADVVSSHYQSLYLWLSGALFAFAALAVCFLALQLVFLPRVHLAVLGEIACLAAIIGAIEWGRHQRILQRWISTRYLAERLRNALFIALAGDREQAQAAPLAADEDPVEPWVLAAFHLVWIRRPPQWGGDGVWVASLRQFLFDAWIEDQRKYFERASQRNRKRHRISTWVVEGLFAASVGIAILHLVLSESDRWDHRLISVLAISLPACAAALAGINAQREYRRNALRYGRIANFLARAGRSMLAASSHAQIQGIAATVDRIMRQERSDWFGTVSLHDLDLP
jgi:hypothetical protein